MMKRLLLPGLLVSFLAISSSCDRGSSDQPASEPTGSADPTAHEPTKAEPPAEPPTATMDPSSFSTQLPSSACDTIQRCKNEELRGYVEFMMAFMGGFASLDKTTGLQPIMSKIGEGMKAEKRLLLNRDECEPLLAKLLELEGMVGAPLLKAVESKRAVFNEDVARQCIENFKTVPTQCGDEKRLTEEIKMSKAEGFEKQFQGPLRDYLKACGAAIEGTIEEGGSCESDVECKVGGCKRQGDSETRTCQSKSS